MLLSLGHPRNRAYCGKRKRRPFLFQYCAEISPRLADLAAAGLFGKNQILAPSEQRSSCLPRLMPNPSLATAIVRTGYFLIVSFALKTLLEEDTKMNILKPLFTASVIAISLASLPGPSWATDQSQQRQQARDTRQQARPEARQTKQDCRAANQKSNAACRQDKRATKQDARKTGRSIKY